MQKPRAIAIDAHDQLYLVDMTARIQVYDADGKYLRGWRTPVSVNGRPTGLIDRQERPRAGARHALLPRAGVRARRHAGGGRHAGRRRTGREPGEFGWVTDVAEDSAGNIYVSEYGDNDRIQKFSPDGEFLLQWGGTGEELGQFRRPQSMAVDDQDRIWVADACNHRIQVFDARGQAASTTGARRAPAPGSCTTPTASCCDGEGHVYVCEYGNDRVQKFTPDGKSLGTWGTHGREPGQLHNPWAIAFDSQGRLACARFE